MGVYEGSFRHELIAAQLREQHDDFNYLDRFTTRVASRLNLEFSSILKGELRPFEYKGVHRHPHICDVVVKGYLNDLLKAEYMPDKKDKQKIRFIFSSSVLQTCAFKSVVDREIKRLENKNYFS
jgi:hypothetical protein